MINILQNAHKAITYLVCSLTQLPAYMKVVTCLFSLILPEVELLPLAVKVTAPG